MVGQYTRPWNCPRKVIGGRPTGGWERKIMMGKFLLIIMRRLFLTAFVVFTDGKLYPLGRG
jgi:hypothetical protein